MKIFFFPRDKRKWQERVEEIRQTWGLLLPFVDFNVNYFSNFHVTESVRYRKEYYTYNYGCSQSRRWRIAYLLLGILTVHV